MNDEIKINKANKSLTIINNGIAFSQFRVADEILDLITNLQQENKMMQKLIDEGVENSYKKLKYLQRENERLKEEKSLIESDINNAYSWLEDYKSRCEKGIEYNNQIIKDTRDFYRPTTDIIYSGDSLIEIATNNINILQNGSENDD